MLSVFGAMFLALSAGHGRAVQQFEQRVDAYLKLRQTVEAKLPPLKPTQSAETINRHESDLAAGIRAARGSAKQGDIFTPPVAAEFRRLIGVTMSGPQAVRIQESLNNAEPVRKRLQVNDSYPDTAPRQSTPPTLLLNLPRLPHGLGYRIAGHDLLLLDEEANLIVDLIPTVIP